jgi:hypothetical protein
MEKENNEVAFQNMDSWRGGSSKSGLSFKQIVLQHINRCVTNGSIEFCGGYSKKTSMTSDYHYVANSREVYCNSVAMLRALLLGYFDEEMLKADKGLQSEYSEKFSEAKNLRKKNITDWREKNREDWREFKVSWHIKMFEELIKLSKRLNFFEEEASEGEEV